MDGVIKLSENLGREAAVDGKETSVIFCGIYSSPQITEDIMKPKKGSFETRSEPRKTSIIRLRWTKTAEDVKVTGSFSNWKGLIMRKED